MKTGEEEKGISKKQSIKLKREAVRLKFEFLLDNKITCVPLKKSVGVKAVELLQKFKEDPAHNLKGDFRNSWHDMLILATAIDYSARLITEDKELNKFAAKQYSGVLNETNDDVVTVDFSNTAASQKNSSESKGYINRGWQVKFRNYGNNL